MTPHPEDHPDDETGGDHHHRALEDRLGAALELGADREEHDGDERADRDPGADAEPHRAEPCAAACALEEREDDRDDQRRLEPLSQRDHACAHQRRLSFPTMSGAPYRNLSGGRRTRRRRQSRACALSCSAPVR